MCLEYVSDQAKTYPGIILLVGVLLLYILTGRTEQGVFLINLQNISLLGLLGLSQTQLQKNLYDCLEYSAIFLKIGSKALPRSSERIAANGRLTLSGLMFNFQFQTLIEVTLIATACVAFLVVIVAVVVCIKKCRSSTNIVDRFIENQLSNFWGLVQYFVLLTIMEHMLSITVAIQWDGLT